MYPLFRYIASVLVLCIPVSLFAAVGIFRVLPNTADDATLEYIEFRNTGCSNVDITGYSIEDASKKRYTFAITSIESHSGYVLGRSTSKIILNNIDETLYLRDGSGTLIDTWYYPTSEK